MHNPYVRLLLAVAFLWVLLATPFGHLLLLVSVGVMGLVWAARILADTWTFVLAVVLFLVNPLFGFAFVAWKAFSSRP